MNRILLLLMLGLLTAACSPKREAVEPADLLLVNGNVYTLNWPEPALDGAADSRAPRLDGRWHGDAQALAIRVGAIQFVGSTQQAEAYRGPGTRVIDVHGATVLPGLIDSHVHVAELGGILSRVNLTGIATEAEAVSKVASVAVGVPKGDWILGQGWDEGAWANHYPDMKLLSEKVPDHPVYLRGLHGFAVWGNRLAFERAGITALTKAPSGGEIRKDPSGRPTGLLLNRAVELLDKALPPLTEPRMEEQILAGLNAMAAAGYVAIHEAGAPTLEMDAFESLNARGKLPIRVYAMLSARDAPLLKKWLARGPDTAAKGMLTTRSVKAYYDGALGSRGARMLDDYADRPGHKGVSGGEYGFDQELVASMMRRGFQASIHAIGDAGNRETLDFIEKVIASDAQVGNGRHRIEHAQVLSAADVPRFSQLGVIASMEPPHAVEDKAWAEARLGADRVRLAYAWRTLRRSGARLAFNSDLPGSDHDPFYGLHSAITRQGKDSQPAGGWYPEQRMTPEEAVRGYTTWGAYSAFEESQTGVLAPGRWADLTVMSVDPFAVGDSDPGALLRGEILLTMVAGKVVYERK